MYLWIISLEVHIEGADVEILELRDKQKVPVGGMY
jgi:hypothetical protein